MRWTAFGVALLSLAAGKPPEIGAWHTFRNWQAVCDNGLACAAFGFDPGGSGAWIRVARDAGDAAPVVTFSWPTNGHAPARLRVAFPGAPSFDLALDGSPTDQEARAGVSSAQTAAVLAGLRDAASVTVGTTAMPLDGSAAALLWMDATQARPRPALPLVTFAAMPRDRAPDPRRLPDAVRALFAHLDCEVAADGRDGSGREFLREAIAARLGARTTLWGRVCSGGAYNFAFVFALHDDVLRRARLVTFPPAPGDAPADSSGDAQAGHMLTNAGLDPRTGTLTSFDKARGIADCGAEASYGWDGHAYRLIRSRSMPDCRGVSPDAWPTTFRTRQH